MTRCAEGHPESLNERHAGYCDRGHPIVETVKRDTRVEASLIADAAEMLQRLRGERAPYFERVMFERLAKGAVEYGEYGFLDSDCEGEALEEPADAGAWAMLGLEKRRRTMPEAEWLEARLKVTDVVARAMSLEAGLRDLQAFYADFDESYSA